MQRRVWRGNTCTRPTSSGTTVMSARVGKEHTRCIERAVDRTRMTENGQRHGRVEEKTRGGEIARRRKRAEEKTRGGEDARRIGTYDAGNEQVAERYDGGGLRDRHERIYFFLFLSNSVNVHPDQDNPVSSIGSQWLVDGCAILKDLLEKDEEAELYSLLKTDL